MDDATEIARKTGAVMVSNCEIVGCLEAKGYHAVVVAPGGTHRVGERFVELLLRHHPHAVPSRLERAGGQLPAFRFV